MTALSSEQHARVLSSLAGAHGKRQPVHTVYGGGHLFTADTHANRKSAAPKR